MAELETVGFPVAEKAVGNGDIDFARAGLGKTRLQGADRDQFGLDAEAVEQIAQVGLLDRAFEHGDLPVAQIEEGVDRRPFATIDAGPAMEGCRAVEVECLGALLVEGDVRQQIDGATAQCIQAFLPDAAHGNQLPALPARDFTEQVAENAAGPAIAAE